MPAFASVPLWSNIVEDLGNINGGLMILEPDMDVYRDLILLAKTENKFTKWAYSEQELLLTYFQFLHPTNYFSLSMLPISAVPLILNDEPNQPKAAFHWHHKKPMDVAELMKTVQIVHFICTNLKPWDWKKEQWVGSDWESIYSRTWHSHKEEAFRDIDEYNSIA